MPDVIVAQRMWQRRDTPATWTSVNPTLADGEIGVEREVADPETIKLKIGDGTTPWVDLPYFGGEGGAVEMRVDSGYIQYKDADGDWVNLIALADLIGPAGPAGADGADGATGPAGADGAPGADGTDGAPGADGAVGPPGPSSSCFPTASFDGGAGAILAGAFCDLYVPFGFEILAWTLVCDQLGSIEIDVRVETYGTFPPTGADSVCGGNPPQVVSDIKAQDSTLTGWSVDVPSGHVIRFYVVSCTGIVKANLVLEGARS